MIVNDIRILIDKLNSCCQKALQSAIGICINNGNYELTSEHIFLALLDDVNNDISLIFCHCGVNHEKVKKQLTLDIDGFLKGNASKPSFSPSLIALLEKSWSLGSLRYNFSTIRSGIIFTIYLDEAKRSISPFAAELRHIDEETLKKDFPSITSKSSENPDVINLNTANTEANKVELEKYCKNFTAEAMAGKTDPILGRDNEIFQVIDILSRRRKNNPILVGDAGVGKTAIIEGLAQQIVAGDVPASLKDVELWELDMGLLQAGASVKGEFEKRLKGVIDIAKKSGGRIILFIDEAHTLIGAGGSAGIGDAANLLKPALARGELRTCAATTWLEYRKYFEKDPALTRRFQLVKVDEPDEDQCCAMLRGIAESYEAHHGVHITEEAIRTAVAISKRFISGRQLPDKAIDVLDTACTRVKMSRSTTPPCIEYRKKVIADANRALKTLNKDLAAGIPIDNNDIVRYAEIKAKTETEIAEMFDKWEEEKSLVDAIVCLQKKMTDARIQGAGEETLFSIKTEIDLINNDLSALAGETPMVYPHVSGAICAQVIGDWTGIPVGSMLKNEAQILLELEKKLSERIKGQDAAVSEIASAIRSAKTKMTNPDAPLGVFLCTGPSGVGKTECAMALADLMFGGEKFSTVINMSEYQEKHTVSQLKGSPPGYVGYGEGGILTEAVRQKPYQIVILDEVEKAHRDVLNMFYQVFDKGIMRDGEGRDIDFKNTIILMTSNLGSDTILQAQEQGITDSKTLIAAIQPELTEHFQPALLARCKVIPFVTLTQETFYSVIRLKMGKIENRLFEEHQTSCSYSDAVVLSIAERCSAMEAGARNIDMIINSSLLPAISNHILSNISVQRDDQQKCVVIDVDEMGEFCISFENSAVAV